jgi:DNA-binding transcriptional MerR regulator
MAAYRSPEEGQSEEDYNPDQLAQILDQTIKHLQAGYTLEECRYLLPQQTGQLSALLGIANQIYQASLQNLPPECETFLAEGRSEILSIAQELQHKPAPEPFSLHALRRFLHSCLLSVLFLLP